MFSSENHVGRLVELRVATPFAAAELAVLQERHVEVIRGVGSDFVVVSDFRDAHVFPPGVADRFVGLMTQVNPGLIRSAVLVNRSAVLGLQAERAIREAGHPDRRAFRVPQKLEEWLAEILTGAEKTRLRQFLDQPPRR